MNNVTERQTQQQQQQQQRTLHNASSDSSSPSPTPSSSCSCYVDLNSSQEYLNLSHNLSHTSNIISSSDNNNTTNNNNNLNIKKNATNSNLSILNNSTTVTTATTTTTTTSTTNTTTNTTTTAPTTSTNINNSTTTTTTNNLNATNNKIPNNTSNSNLKNLTTSMSSRKFSLYEEDKLKIISEDNDKKMNVSVTTGSSPELLKKDLKKLRENYLTEKKRITNDLLTIMRDERIIILADWLKIRSSFKNWLKVYAILKPGILLLYKSTKVKSHGQWIGTVLLNSCELLERPSKKHGFCFKLFHPLEKSIWASKGPEGESSLNVYLLPTFYLIFRSPSEQIGRIWMDALELTMKSSTLLKRTFNNNPTSFGQMNNEQSLSSINTTATTTSISTNNSHSMSSAQLSTSLNLQSNTKLIEDKLTNSTSSSLSTNTANNTVIPLIINTSSDDKDVLTSTNDSEIENKHFKDFDVGDDINLSESEKNSSDDDCSFNSSIISPSDNDETNNTIEQTVYVQSPVEEFGELGNKGQTEDIDDENKSLIFCLAKQVRPGMDLSKVILPTFILEPRSFLEKLTDFYYHCDIINEAIRNDDPYQRIKHIIKFYLSGFYKKPKGLKKPYNPILGEVFRCYWNHPNSNSRTYYIAEQVSHHPPITAFYAINRKEGFCIYGTVLARSKFYGNSVSAIMDGQVKLTLLDRGEEYLITMPYANCKGILIGKLTMELGGKVTIDCPKTGYSAELEFKLKPFFGGIDASNLIEGKIKFEKETVASIHGKWDGEILIHEKRTNHELLLWYPSKSIIEQRLKRYIVPFDEQKDFESEKVWLKVSYAIKNCDQVLATEEKTKIEQRQREADLDRKQKNIPYIFRYFTQDPHTKQYMYNYSDLRPWDPITDDFQYEKDFKICTKTVKYRTATIDQHHNQIINEEKSQLISSEKLLTNSNFVTSNIVESSSLILQFNVIKQRLDQMEEHLNKLNANMNNLLNKPSSNSSLNTTTNSSALSQLTKNNNTIFLYLFLIWSSGVFIAWLTKLFFT